MPVRKLLEEFGHARRDSVTYAQYVRAHEELGGLNTDEKDLLEKNMTLEGLCEIYHKLYKPNMREDTNPKTYAAHALHVLLPRIVARVEEQ